MIDFDYGEIRPFNAVKNAGLIAEGALKNMLKNGSMSKVRNVGPKTYWLLCKIYEVSSDDIWWHNVHEPYISKLKKEFKIRE